MIQEMSGSERPELNPYQVAIVELTDFLKKSSITQILTSNPENVDKDKAALEEQMKVHPDLAEYTRLTKAALDRKRQSNERIGNREFFMDVWDRVLKNEEN